MRGRTAVAPARSNRSGWGSWENTVTSWPARAHSRTSACV